MRSSVLLAVGFEAAPGDMPAPLGAPGLGTLEAFDGALAGDAVLTSSFVASVPQGTSDKLIEPSGAVHR
jgi:hypothetical protein